METAKHYYELMTDFAGFAIQDRAIKKFTQEALSATYNETLYKNHRNFFIDPSSSSGKHHPPEDNGEGGIVRHLLKSAFVGPTLLQDHDLNIRKNEVLPRKLENGIITQKEYDVEIKTLNQISEKNDFYNFFTKTDYDMVISANLIHDICKNCKDFEEPEGLLLGEWSNKTNYSHGLLGYNFLENFMLREPEKETIRQMVRKHMGQFPELTSELVKMEDTSILEDICISSDRTAATKSMSFLPGNPLYKKQFSERPTVKSLKKAWKQTRF